MTHIVTKSTKIISISLFGCETSGKRVVVSLDIV